MGGGDLNLKKSWHPNTIKNQERVWRAEQADAAEKRKLAELKQEISAERDREELHRIGQKSGVLPVGGASMQQMAGMGGGGGATGGGTGSKKLEWMYQGAQNLLNREEYLLGRQVDKSFEKQAADEQLQKQQGDMVGVTRSKNHVEHECIPFSIRQFHGTNVSEEQVDLQRKIAEDPLMAVKQREMETRKKLLENPVKLAEIHRLLRTESSRLAEEGGGHRHKSKKSKKAKKAKKEVKKEPEVVAKRPRNASSSSRSGSDDEGGGADLDAQLANQLRKVDGGGQGGDIKQLLELKYRQINEELDKYSSSRKQSKKSKKSKKRKASKSKKSKKSKSDSDSSSSNSEDEKAATKPVTVQHVNPFARPSDPVRAALAEVAEAKQKYVRPLPPMRPPAPKRPTSVDRMAKTQRRDRSRSASVERRRHRSRTPPKQKPSRRERGRRHRSSSSSSSTSSSSVSPDRRRKNTSKVAPPTRSDHRDRRRSSSRTDTRRTAADKPSDRRRDDSKTRRRRSPSAASSSSSSSVDRKATHKSKRPDEDRSRRDRNPSPDRPRRSHRSRSPRRSASPKPNRPAEVDLADMSTKFATVSSKRPIADAQSSTPPPKSRLPRSSDSSDTDDECDEERKAAMQSMAARNYGLVTAAGDKIALKNLGDHPKPSAADDRSRAKLAPAASTKPVPKKQPLTEEERAQRLAEMQANAEWRDDDRRRAVGAYRAAERLEQSEQHDRFDRDFANKAMQQAMATQHSVESRLRANKNNIQRRPAAMDENFARR